MLAGKITLTANLSVIHTSTLTRKYRNMNTLRLYM